MNCPMRLGLSDTTCPQRLREQNPVKVVFVLYTQNLVVPTVVYAIFFY
jgi:hypothetical protein